jgi:type II secretory pathway component PulF
MTEGKDIGTRRGRLSATDLEVLNRQIIVAARAGAPLVPALASLSRDLDRGRLKEAVDQLTLDLSAGHSLSEAIDRQPGRFPPLYTAMARAADAGGNLQGVMEVLSELVTSVSGLRRKVVTASVYPLMVLVIGLGILSFVAATVIPRLTSIAIPMWTGEVPIQADALLLGAVAVIGLFAIAGIIALMLATLVPMAPGRLGMWMPVFGPVLRAQRAFLLSRTLAVLLRSGVPLREAMGVVREVAGDQTTRTVLDGVIEDLHAGRRLGEAMSTAAAKKAIPVTLAWMTAISESRGDLPEGLYEASEFYRAEAERRAQFIAQVLPPVLILGVGCIVAMIAFATLRPLVSALSAWGHAMSGF